MTNDLRERVILIHRRTRTFQTNEVGEDFGCIHYEEAEHD